MDSSAAGLPLYSRRGILYRRWAEGLPVPMFYLPRREADPLAHAALGRNCALHPRTGLIGCFSHDGKMILATAWEPYQDLFVGIVACLHARSEERRVGKEW